MDTQADVVLTYRGPAVDGAMMNAHDLGVALDGMAGLIEETNRSLNGERAFAEVSVHSQFERGSFEIHFGIDIGPLKTTLDLGILDVRSILSIIGISGAHIPGSSGGVVGSVIELVRRLTGRPIEKIEPAVPEVPVPPATLTKMHVDPDNGIVDVTIKGEHDPIRAIREVGIVATNLAARKFLSNVTAPLEREGMDELVMSSGQGQTRITRAESGYFLPPATAAASKDLGDMVAGTYKILSPAFDGKKWRLSDGASRFSASVSDPNFLSDMSDGRLWFVAGDAISAEVKVTQQDGHRPTHEIVRVTGIVRGGTGRTTIQPPLLSPGPD